MPPRILITRAPHQASALADAVRSLGAEPILIPTIEIVDPTSFVALDLAITDLDAFHWLIFTSANAVAAFHNRVCKHQGWTEASEAENPTIRKTAEERRAHLGAGGTRVAAIGSATAAALTAINLPPDLVPPQAVAESLTEALLPHTLQPDGTPTYFLLVRAEQARDHLVETLSAAGAEVAIAPAYRTITPAGSVDTLRELFAHPSRCPDAVTFTSSSSVTNLLEILHSAGLTLPPEIRRISIGPITSATLQQAGLPPHAQAEEATVTALAAACLKVTAQETVQFTTFPMPQEIQR